MALEIPQSKDYIPPFHPFGSIGQHLPHLRAPQPSGIEAPRPGFFQGVTAAVRSDWAIPYIMNEWRDSGFSSDINFRASDHWEELAEGVPADYAAELNSAVSYDHAKELQKRLIQKGKDRETLSRMGVPGVMLRMGMSIVDPAAIAVSAATFGLATPLIYASKATRLQRMARVGLVTMSGESLNSE